MMRFSGDERGFTLIEVTIILMVLVGLSTIILPQLGNFNRLAHFVKAKEDLTAICVSAKKMLDEVMLGAFYGNPRKRELPIGLLVGPGAIPQDGVVSSSLWTQPLYAEFTQETDGNAVNVEFLVDTFEHHLQENNPLDGYAYNARYDNPLEDAGRSGVGAFFGWRGPYLDVFTPDPWGNRYMANVFALYRPGDVDPTDLFTSAVVCYSTGPDLGADTAFNQPMDDGDGDGGFGWLTGADDIAVVLSAGGPF